MRPLAAVELENAAVGRFESLCVGRGGHGTVGLKDERPAIDIGVDDVGICDLERPVADIACTFNRLFVGQGHAARPEDVVCGAGAEDDVTFAFEGGVRGEIEFRSVAGGFQVDGAGVGDRPRDYGRGIIENVVGAAIGDIGQVDILAGAIVNHSGASRAQRAAGDTHTCKEQDRGTIRCGDRAGGIRPRTAVELQGGAVGSFQDLIIDGSCRSIGLEDERVPAHVGVDGVVVDQDE